MHFKAKSFQKFAQNFLNGAFGAVPIKFTSFHFSYFSRKYTIYHLVIKRKFTVKCTTPITLVYKYRPILGTMPRRRPIQICFTGWGRGGLRGLGDRWGGRPHNVFRRKVPFFQELGPFGKFRGFNKMFLAMSASGLGVAPRFFNYLGGQKRTSVILFGGQGSKKIHLYRSK